MTKFTNGERVVINYADPERARRAALHSRSGRVGVVTIAEDMLGHVRVQTERNAAYLPEDLISFDDVQKVPTLALIMRHNRPANDDFAKVFAPNIVVKLISISPLGDEAIVQTLDSRPEWNILNSLVIPVNHLQFFHRSNSVHAFRSFALGQVLKGLPPLHESATGENYVASNGNIDLIQVNSDIEGMYYYLSEAIILAGKLADNDGLEDTYRATMREYSNRLYIVMSALGFAEELVREEYNEQGATARMEKYQL